MKNVLFICALACTLTAGAQSPDKTAAIKALVESGKFLFRPMTVLPIHGQVRQLTSDFDMTVTVPGKIVSNLPYYGRAYTPIDPAKGGMDFTTTKFDYKITPRKKGGWEITIKPKDLQGDVEQLYLSITQDGYATLQVTSSNRDAISYNGSVMSPE
jgi:hypothetical protein